MQCNFAILNKNLTNIISLRPTVRPVTFGSEELDIEAQKNGLFCALSHFLVQQMFVNSVKRRNFIAGECMKERRSSSRHQEIVLSD